MARALFALALLFAAVYAALWWGVLRMDEPASWPPAPSAVTADGALAATAAFVSRNDVTVNDLGMQFAWSTAATAEPLVDGEHFYPLMLDDIAAARSSIHLLYGCMLEAGVEIWEYPDAVVHGKVLVADDSVMFGTINLDAWALYRAYEVGAIVAYQKTADLFESRLFEPDIAISRPGKAPRDGWTRFEDWLADSLSYFL